jgi:D-xylose transport system permease protein
MSAVAEPSQSPVPGGPTVEGEERVTLTSYATQWWTNIRSGELGSLPIIVGIIVISIYFQSRNSNFLTSGNFVNLIAQMSAITVIGMGIVFVLLLGEIDLSVGYVSGVGGAICAVLLFPDGNQVATSVAIVLALGAGLGIGLFQGSIITKVGIPSFVVTLAGLLAWNGVVLKIVGDRGTIVVQDKFVNGIANDYVNHTTAWIVIEGAVALYAATILLGLRQRRRHGLPTDPVSLVALRIAALAIAGGVVVYVCNQNANRGLPYVGLLLVALLIGWTFVLNRTKFGRHVFAVGGNAEAARRAGINVDRIRVLVFGIAGMMAAVGGIIFASRLSSVDTNAGGGSILLYSIAAAVIGGTSLFGGRGNIKSALLGALVIASIDNGLGLLNVGDDTKFIVTGVVLLAAVTVDSLARRGREHSGRA